LLELWPHGGEVIKFCAWRRKLRNIRGGSGFDVKQGLMTSRAIVLDTSDTLLRAGQTSFSHPKRLIFVQTDNLRDVKSILMFSCQLRIGGVHLPKKRQQDQKPLHLQEVLALR
jgi:hypothetical protein